LLCDNTPHINNSKECEICNERFCKTCIDHFGGRLICVECRDIKEHEIMEQFAQDIDCLEAQNKILKEEIARLKGGIADAHKVLKEVSFVNDDMLENACRVGRATGILDWYIEKGAKS
jgi:hypothetical protein